MAAKKTTTSEEKNSGEEKNEDTKNTGEKDQAQLSRDPDSIIKDHMIYALAAGAIPIPLLDIGAVTAVQYNMIRQLTENCGINFDREQTKTLITSIIGASVGTYLGSLGASLVKGIPGIGTILGIGSQAILAGATTYAIGHVFQAQLAEKGSLSDFDINLAKKTFSELLEKGKAEAKKHHKKRKGPADRLKELQKMKDEGIITEEEYEATKQEILKKMSS